MAIAIWCDDRRINLKLCQKLLIHYIHKYRCTARFFIINNRLALFSFLYRTHSLFVNLNFRLRARLIGVERKTECNYFFISFHFGSSIFPIQWKSHFIDERLLNVMWCAKCDKCSWTVNTWDAGALNRNANSYLQMLDKMAITAFVVQ